MHNGDQEDWAHQFWTYMEQTYVTTDTPTLIWHTTEHHWYLYADEGVYQPIPEEDVTAIFVQWASDHNQIPQGRIRNTILYLKAKLHTAIVWDNHHYHDETTTYTSIENLKNGLLDVTTKTLFPHTHRYLSKHQIPRTYLPDIIEMPALLRRLYDATTDWEKLQKFMVLAIHNDHTQEVFLMCYGPKGAGKSTFLQLIQNMYGKELVSKTAIQDLGKHFGMSDIYDKRFNVNPDLSNDPLSTGAISRIKQMTGQDGDIEVELKGVNRFTWPIQFFLLFGANQLMEFAKYGVCETDSIMRRAVLVHFPVRKIRDPNFKLEVIEPQVLDAIYSYWVWCPVTQMYSDAEMDGWIESTKQQWWLDSQPIMRICKEEFEYAEEGTLPCADVVASVATCLERDGMTPPKDLQADITEALKTMGILKNNKRGALAEYHHIHAISDEPFVITKSMLDHMLAEKKGGSK